MCKMQTAMIRHDLIAFWKAGRAERNGLSGCDSANCNNQGVRAALDAAGRSSIRMGPEPL